MRSRGIHSVGTSDAALVRRVQTGDTRAYADLVARYRDRLGRYALHMLGNREDADEGILQHFLRVFSISEHVQRVPAQAIAIPRDEIGVSTGVAGLHTAHQGGVARPHAVYTH